jgi:hypothetical protein
MAQLCIMVALNDHKVSQMTHFVTTWSLAALFLILYQFDLNLTKNISLRIFKALSSLLFRLKISQCHQHAST